VLDAYGKEAKKKREYWTRLTRVKRDTIVAALQAIEIDGLALDGVWARSPALEKGQRADHYRVEGV
jgi:hypothetical protein